MFLRFLLRPSALLFVLPLLLSARMPATTLHVADFGAIPDNGLDDTPAIQRAIDAALAQGATRLEFAPGVYDLIDSALRGGQHLLVKNASGLTLAGAPGADGLPATRLVRHWEGLAGVKNPPSILRVRDSRGFALHDIAFDNSPRFTTAGRVVEAGPDQVVVEIFPGLPRLEGVRAYAANAWDLATRRLKQVPSVSFGGDVDRWPAASVWRNVAGGEGRRQRLDHPGIGRHLAVGDGLSWHFGWEGRQLAFQRCEGLRVERVAVFNAVGFAIEAINCRDIESAGVRIKPEGDQLAVSARDGWKLYGCGGRVRLRDLHVEGVRWDGQNVHGSFLWVEERLDERRLRLRKLWSAFSIPDGSRLLFWDGDTQVPATIRASKIESSKNNVTRYEVEFAEPLPAFVARDAMASVEAWDIPEYTLERATFRNIAGCAVILRNRHARIVDSTFEDIMYPAIMVGASVNEGEGTYPEDVAIEGCTFRRSGWQSRQGAQGMIGINSSGGTERRMGRVRVVRNRFEDAATGLDIAEVRDVALDENTFNRVVSPWRIHAPTTGRVLRDGAEVSPGPP